MNSIRIARQALPRKPVLARSYAWVKPPVKKEADPMLAGQDYPQLDDVHSQNKPPLGWWDNQERRNWGDTIHEQEAFYGMWGPDAPPIEPAVALKQWAIVFSSIATFVVIAKTFLVPELPAVRRQYPFGGLVTEMGGIEEIAARKATDGEEED